MPRASRFPRDCPILDEPAIAVRDLTGALQTWVDIGLPEPERLHRASKAAPRVAVYTHKDPLQWAAKLKGREDPPVGEARSLRARPRMARTAGREARAEDEVLAGAVGGRVVNLTTGEVTSQTVLARPLHVSDQH
jgi:hypothetical protein